MWWNCSDDTLSWRHSVSEDAGLTTPRAVMRADAGRVRGLGHVMRLRALAERLRTLGWELDLVGEGLPTEQGPWTAVHQLAPDRTPAPIEHLLVPLHQENDARTMLAAVAGDPIDTIIVDHYGLGTPWEAEVSRGSPRSRVVAIDDLAGREHEADLVIDPNLGDAGATRPPGGGCRLLRGTAYAPLSLDYRKPRETELSARATPRIVVSLGGGNSELIVALSAQLCDDPRLVSVALEFVIPTERDRAAVEQHVGGRPDTVVHGQLASLRGLLESATLAIGAGGTSAWERLRLGVPAVIVALAKNQERTCRELSYHGVARWIEESKDVAAIVEAAVLAIDDAALQARVRRIGPLLVDGRGADRIAMALAGPRGPITLREVREHDAAAIFAMANDPDTRASSRETSAIRPDEHLDWFEHRREVDRGTFWVAEDGDLVVGQVRFSRVSGAWEVSFALEAAARGFGLSEGMIREGIRRLRAHCRDAGGPTTVVGVVHESNGTSRRIFDKLGFRQDLTEAEACSLGSKVGRDFTAYVLTSDEPTP